ncbi:peptidoglycan editing factor PgeF [Agaribacterium haliotis]|uniref:peptidoglycan editing factor PgeF n=1 Tax=Agaribacterium haliotis TaxID=2013869 RepID=UPI000BB5700A|nr:peptidoglycan editing factor PgeF [Agaribacterium haliotis]
MLFQAKWPAPASVKTALTTRDGGVSAAPFDSFNLASHVGDLDSCVQLNRQRLSESLQNRASASPKLQWLTQVHGTELVELDCSLAEPIEADASYTKKAGVACVVMTADCLPLLICDKAGSQVAAVHAGWKGLADGIVSRAVAAFDAPASELMVYLGPAISQAAFEVGEDVRQAFENAQAQRRFAEPIAHAFCERAKQDTSGANKFFADLYRLARSELCALGVRQIYGGDFCTYSDKQRFFSYRRDGRCGRMASLIWLAD